MQIFGKNYFRPLIYLLISIVTIIFFTYFYLKNEEQKLLHSKYSTLTTNIEEKIKNLINEKNNATLAMAISFSKDERLINFLNGKNELTIDYAKISAEIKENTKFKNIWIQIIDINGNSLYRSWTNIVNNISFRKDFKQTLIDKKASTTFSVGRFDFNIKANSPIYFNNEVIGFIEVISHFNSIVETLKENHINAIVIADKKYKETIKFPFSNTFIADYYVATKNNDEINKNLNAQNIEEIINLNGYSIKNNILIYTYKLSNNFDENLGYVINFVDLNSIDIENIKSFKSQFITNTVILVILMFFLFISYVYFNETANNTKFNTKLKKHIKQLNNLQKYKQYILDSQTNIIVITNGKTLINCNKRLLEFFKDVSNLNEFREKYVCVCKAFVHMNDELYIIDKEYDNNKNWAEYIVENPNKKFKVAMYDHEKALKHFSINVSRIKINNSLIVTLTDITFEIEQIELDKEKDRIFFQQSKISAIADILKNIGHQWRQPLSIISTVTSGMKLHKELNILDEKDFIESCNTIINNTNKLSNTIENFTSFFDNDEKNSKYSLIETIENIKKFMDSIFERNNIECIFSFDNDLVLDCKQNELSQAILNILDNSIHALIHNQNENHRIILIEFKNKILQIKDSGNGIDESIISKVFEPYFTTKHQSFGVGLGLHMVNEFFVKTLGYKVNIKNVSFTYKNHSYKGTNFIINFD